MARVVTAPVALVTDENGQVQYVYRGGNVPSYVKGDQLKHLVDNGLVGSDTELVEEAPVEKPAGNASLEDWQVYARTQGATDADLEGQKQSDLRKTFG